MKLEEKEKQNKRIKKKETITLKIHGMTCSSCVTHVTNALKTIDGVATVSIPGWQQGIGVIQTSREVSNKAIKEAITKAGYQAKITAREEIGAQKKEPSLKFFDYDLVVIGTGGAGMAAAIKGAELGFRIAIIEKGIIGGTCVNIGCVPSKTLIKIANTKHSLENHPFKAIITKSVSFSWPKVIEQKDHLVNKLRKSKYEEVIASYENITLLRGTARFVDKHTIIVNNKKIATRTVIIATGAQPRILAIKGSDQVELLTSTSIMALEKQPKSLIIIGGRAIALELGQAFSRFGTKVTILQRSDTILPEHDLEIAKQLTAFLREEGIQIITNVKLEEIQSEKKSKEKIVFTKVKGQPQQFQAEAILMAVGREPNTSGMGLENIGVQLDEQGFIQTNEQLQTNLPGIFAAGDVTPNPKFIYVAAAAGKIAAENALTKSNKVLDLSTLPRVIFTEPQVATVGITEREAIKQGLTIETTTLPLEYVPQALAAHNTKGFIKLLREKDSRQLVGAHILAANAGELITLATILVAFSKKYSITTEEVAEQFFPYLTQMEGLKLALLTFSKDLAKLSCCAT